MSGVTWVRIDDDLFTHPKFTEAWDQEPAAIGLWLFAAAHSGKNLLDGDVPRRFVRPWFRTPARQRRATDALVDVHLWVPNGAGWQIHDWAEYNPPRERILERRRADLARKQGRR